MKYFGKRLATAVSAMALAGGIAHQAAAQSHAFKVETFKPWSGYAIPNGEWLSADFDGDGRDDVVHIVAGRGYAHTWRSLGNGKFDVGTFKPWAGYATPNGQWLVADLNNDNRDDLVHVVQGKDYIHSWLSKGDGTFAVGTFRPWRGYAMPNGQWKVIDFNADGRDDLVHIVAGKDYVHTWRSLGNGRFNVGTFKPWRGYAMPNGVWLTGDIDGDGDGDLVHAVRGKDYVHTWRSNRNGTFTVGTFKPWNGYAIPNGQWLSLDFDGDGKDDIAHVVANTDYIHTWRSRGNGSYDVGTFRPWRGYAMPNGVWRAGDFDKDGKDDLVHAVASHGYAHTWLSRGDGKFNVGTFRPWPGYAIPNGVWLTGDHNGDGKMDIVHAVKGRDYVHPWLSLLPAPGELYVDGLEITQTVQDMAHSVALVGSKPTVVRVYPALRGSAPRQVRGRMSIWNTATRSWTTVDSSNAVTVSPGENGQIRRKREDTDRGLNFVVPASHRVEGWMFVRFQGFRDANSGAVLPCSGCGRIERWGRMGDRNTYRVRALGMRYSNGSPAATFQPRALDYQLLGSWLRRAYPTGDLRYSTATVNSNLSAPFSCSQVNARLVGIRNADINSGSRHRLTHYYGMTYRDSDQRSFFMRGCAAGIPSNPNAATVSSGPTGPTGGWDTDGSFGDWYGGHEIGHTMGRHHIGSGCGETASDPGYPYPNGQISNNDGAFVGFDTGDAARNIPMAALPGTVWTDVMSYCSNQWISDYTYNAIRVRIAAENSSGATGVAGPIASEAVSGSAADIVEGYAQEKIAGYDGFTGGIDPDYIAPAGQPELAIAEMPQAPSLDPEPEYAQPAELVTANSGAMVAVDAAYADISGAADPDLPPMMTPPSEEESVNGGEPPAAAAALADVPEAAAASLSEGDFLALAAVANLTRNEGEIVDIRRVSRGLVPLGDIDSPVELEALDADGNLLQSWSVPFLPSSENHEGEDQTGVVDAVVPFPPGIASLRLIIQGQEADRFTAAAAAPAAPTMAAPMTAQTVEGAKALDWSGVGTAPEGASYDVQISTDGGESWETIGLGLSDPAEELDLSGYEGDNATIRVLLNTGFETQIVSEQLIDLQN